MPVNALAKPIRKDYNNIMNYWQGKKVVVTGGAGFIGSHMVERLLREGASVTVTLRQRMDVTQTYLAPIARDIHVVNVRLEDEPSMVPVLKGQDWVLNIAAHMGGLLYSSKNHAYMFYENLRPAISMMEAARLAEVPNYLVCSTACVYPGDAETPIKETEGFRSFPQETNEGYGMAKRTQEYMGMLYAKRYGMHIPIARPFNAYGPRDDFHFDTSHVIPALIRRCLAAPQSGELLVYGTGNAIRALVYCDDFVSGLLAVAEKGPSGDPINVGTGDYVTIRELAEKVMTATGRTDLYIHFDTSKPEGQMRRYADTTKAREMTGFECKVSLDEGLQNTVEWFKGEVAAGRLQI